MKYVYKEKIHSKIPVKTVIPTHIICMLWVFFIKLKTSTVFLNVFTYRKNDVRNIAI